MTRALLAALLLLIAGCSLLPISARDLLGTYVMNRGRAADTLIVLQDGRYRRVYAMPSQPVVIDSGGWAVDRSGVRFAAMWPRWRTETEPSTLRRVPLAPVSWSMEASRALSGRLRLSVDEDLDWAYVRRR